MTDLTTTETFVREADLLALGSDAWVEVVNGEIVAMSPNGLLHHFVGGNSYDLINPFVKENRLGYVFMDGLIYYLRRDGDRLYDARVPDVSFVRKGRLPADWDIEKPFPGAPTLAIEVMSPDDKLEDVVEKVGDYLAAGSEQVWVMLPRTREVYQYVPGADQVRIYRGDDHIEAESLFPGLKLALPDIFALPELE